MALRRDTAEGIRQRLYQGELEVAKFVPQLNALSKLRSCLSRFWRGNG